MCWKTRLAPTLQHGVCFPHRQELSVQAEPLMPGRFGGLLGSALLEPLPQKLQPGFLVFSRPGAAGPLALRRTVGLLFDFSTIYISLSNFSCES